MRPLVSTALLLSLAAPAAARELPAGTGSISAAVADLKDAVADRGVPDATVHEKAANLFRGLPSAAIVVDVALRGWDKERGIEGDPASVERLLKSASRRLSEAREVPSPEFKEAFQYAGGLHGAGKVDFNGKMPDGQMGFYRYLAGQAGLGVIKLNARLSALAALIGDAFAFSTLIHEAGHARDHVRGKLDGSAVIAGEVLAFKTQHEWLKLIDPRKERVCWLRAVLAERQRRKPDALTNAALGFLEHLAALQETDGDEGRIRELVERLGYHDGHERQGGPVSS